jgi:CPA1 family monovalent cation:H+ antiporter
MLILIAFTAAAGSLLIQGGTLAWLATRLGLAGLDTVPEGERQALDQALGEAAITALHDPTLRQPSGEAYDPRILALVTLRLGVTRLEAMSDEAGDLGETWAEDDPSAVAPASPPDLAETLEQARRRLVGDDDDPGDEATLDTVARKRQHRELRMVTLEAMREALLEARALGAYSHTSLSDALAVLDAEEIGLELRARTLD